MTAYKTLIVAAALTLGTTVAMAQQKPMVGDGSSGGINAGAQGEANPSFPNAAGNPNAAKTFPKSATQSDQNKSVGDGSSGGPNVGAQDMGAAAGAKANVGATGAATTGSAGMNSSDPKTQNKSVGDGSSGGVNAGAESKIPGAK